MSVAAEFSPEIKSIYTDDKDRFIVALVVGYKPEDGITTPEEAARAALDLTRDEGAGGTQWYVLDRKTGQGCWLEQKTFDDEADDWFDSVYG